MRTALILLMWPLPILADVCAPADIQNAYGFQLAGTSTISGKPTPVAAIGRLVFDPGGKVSGYSSVNFNGLFLGNPVTGTYEIDTGCGMTWKLQDTSGGWQSFAAKVKPGGSQIQFRQTDAGAGTTGLMLKLAPTCNDGAFIGPYTMAIGAISTPFATGVPGTQGGSARVQADGSGGQSLVWPREQTSGTYAVDADCFVSLEFAVPGGDPVKLRGVLLDSGNQVMAVHTDPQMVGTARLRR